MSFNHCVSFRRVFLWTLFCGFLWQPSISKAQMGKIDTGHITDKSFVVFRIDFKEVLKQIDKESADLKRVSRMLKQELEIDLQTVTALTFQIGDPVEGDNDPVFAATIELEKALDQTSLLDQLRGSNDFTETKYRGKTYLKPTSQYDPSVYFESASKFTLASSTWMESIIDAHGMGNNSSKLKAIPAGSELAIVLSKTEDSEQSGKQFLSRMGVPVDGLLTFWSSLESGVVYFHSTSGVPFHMQATFDNAEVTAKAKSSLESLVAMGKVAVPGVKGQLKDQIEELKDSTEGFAAMQRGMMKKGLKGLDMSEILLAGMDIQVKGKTLDVQSKHMGGIKGFGELLFFGMQALVLGGSDVPAGPPVGPVEKAEKDLRKK